MSAPTSRVSLNRRTLLRAGAGMAGILATGRAPAFAQTQPKKLVFAHINAVAGIGRGRVRLDGEGGQRAVQGRARHAVLRQDPDPAGTGGHERGQVRQHRDGQPGGRRRNRVSGNGRAARALSGEGLCLRLRHAQRRDRRQARASRSRTTTSSRCSAISITASAISGPRRSRSSSRRTCAA